MIKKPFLWLIIIYKTAISPFLPPRCRFYPSCSEYAHGAIERHGVLRGIYFAVMRLLRCHPFNPGGYDPVPEAKGLLRNRKQEKAA